MRFTSLLPTAIAMASSTFAYSSSVTSSAAVPLKTAGLNETLYQDYEVYKPQMFLINMFEYEQELFLAGFDLTYNVTIPGLSPIYPDIHCNANYTLCQVTTGEGEINAASTLTALALSPLFDLTETYWLVAGIAGISPLQGTIGDVTFARFAVQILEYETDAREMPANWTTGYYAFGTTIAGEYPGNIYGTEVFELNENLRDRALEVASKVELTNGTDGNAAFRELYNYAPANMTPSVRACDTLTSDTYWYGQLFDEAFTNYTELMTNGTGTYCTTQQEDNATLEALLRAAQYGLVDFSRIVVMRSASDFTYADYYTERNETTYMFNDVSQGGSFVSVWNLFLAGEAFIVDVLTNYDTLYSNSTFINDNYIGDMFGSLDEPDYREWGLESWGTA